MDFNFLKFYVDSTVRITKFNKGTLLVYPIHFGHFLGKVLCEACYGGTKSGTLYFLMLIPTIM